MEKINLFRTLISSFALTTLISCGGSNQNQEESQSEETTEEKVVNVYTHRFYDADKELFAKFEEITGVKVNVKEDKADKLIALLQSEAENTEADVLITVDAGRLYYAKELGLLQSVESETLEKNIPNHLQDPDNHWFALTKRCRAFMVKGEEAPASYEDLADESWKGKIFIRSSSNIYNQSLMASIIARYGEEKAQAWAEAVVANMARAPKGNDRDQIKEVANAEGMVAVANSYYLGKLLNSDNEMEKSAGESVRIAFPDQDTHGAHINVSGAGVTKHSPNTENAILLLEFLAGENAQQIFAESNFEYPVHPNVSPSDLLQSWGSFKEDTLSLELLGKYNAKAIEIFELAGWE